MATCLWAIGWLILSANMWEARQRQAEQIAQTQERCVRGERMPQCDPIVVNKQGQPMTELELRAYLRSGKSSSDLHTVPPKFDPPPPFPYWAYLLGLFLPPTGFNLMGRTVGWIINGFRA